MPPPTDPQERPSSAGAADPSRRLRQLEKALDTMQVGVTITDRAQRIVYANPAEAAMHGYRVEELIGRPATIFAPPSLWKPLPPEKLEEVGSWRRESVNVRKDGSTFPVEILSDVVTDAEGRPTGIVSISQDITQRKQAEEALRESEQRYALAMRGASDGLWDWNLKTGKIYYSPRWKLMLGCSDEEVGETPEEWWQRVHPEDLQRVRADLQRHLDGQTEHFQCEHRMIHADGTYCWMLSRGLAVREEGTPLRIAGSQTDITDRCARPAGSFASSSSRSNGPGDCR